MNKEIPEHLLSAKPYFRCTTQTLFLPEHNDTQFTDKETKALKLNVSKGNKEGLKLEVKSILLQNHSFFHYAVGHKFWYQKFSEEMEYAVLKGRTSS